MLAPIAVADSPSHIPLVATALRQTAVNQVLCRPMADDPIKDAFDKVKEEYEEFRNHWGKVLEAISEVDQCKPGDDMATMMEKLEDTVHKVRTGGVFGSGVNGYTRALEDWKELSNGKK